MALLGAKNKDTLLTKNRNINYRNVTVTSETLRSDCQGCLLKYCFLPNSNIPKYQEKNFLSGLVVFFKYIHTYIYIYIYIYNSIYNMCVCVCVCVCVCEVDR